GLCRAAGGADHDLPAVDAIIDAQAARLVFVNGHRGGTGVDKELHRLAVDRAGDPVVTALPLGDAQLLALGLGKTRAELTAETVATLDTFDPQHGAPSVGADHHDTTRPRLPHPHQFALAVDIQHRGTGK